MVPQSGVLQTPSFCALNRPRCWLLYGVLLSSGILDFLNPHSLSEVLLPGTLRFLVVEMDSGSANEKFGFVGCSWMRGLLEKYLGCESFCISRYHFIGLFRSMDIGFSPLEGIGRGLLMKSKECGTLLRANDAIF